MWKAVPLCAVMAMAALASCDRPTPTSDKPDAAVAVAAVPTVPTVAWEPAARDEAIAAGRAVIEKHECTRCHTIDDLPAASRPRGCTSCHLFLKGLAPDDKARKAIADKYGEPIIARYQRNIVHLREVPNLTKIARRVRPAFLRDFLHEPFDVRPLLEESMIRHHLNDAEIRAVVRYFAARGEAADPWADKPEPESTPPAPSAERIEAGKKLFTSKGCTSCHTFGNVETGVTAARLREGGMPAALAPNLRFAKDRVRREAIVPWILSPQSISPGTVMPPLGLTVAEAETVRDFLLFADPLLKPVPAPLEPTVPPLLTRPVAYDEVKERVLGKVCVHCHMNDYEKDPGPGNRGGLGYAGIRFSTRTYETLVAGANDAKGGRYSVLVPRAGETVPPILKAMLRRRVEEQRDRVAPFEDHVRPSYPAQDPGMPLGLPSMTDEELAILATWIANGCPGPTKVTGMPGIDDGFLVPDGPAEKNQGCELRAVPARRPAWAVDAKDAGVK
jgi:mono/diheme cytochrome c family protein